MQWRRETVKVFVGTRVLPDPVENSVSLAHVLAALPDPEVHRRSLDRSQEAIDGVS